MIIIDTFDTPFTNPPPRQDIWLGGTVDNPTVASGYSSSPAIRKNQPTNQVIGSSRLLSVVMTKNDLLAMKAVRSYVIPKTSSNPDGVFGVTNNAKTESITTLRWDCNGAGLASTGQQNITPQGESEIQLSFLRLTAPTALKIALTDVDGNNQEIETITNSNLAVLSLNDYVDANPALDLHNIATIELSMVIGNWSIAINRIAIV